MNLESQDKLQSIIDWAIVNDIDEERLPRDIETLSQITDVNLSHLELTSIPDNICNVSKLKKLSMSFND